MQKQEIEKLNDIKQFNAVMLEQYKKLAELETEGKLESEEYKEIISHIEMIHDVTSKKIRQLNINPEDLINYEDLIASLGGFAGEDTDIIIDVLEQKIDSLSLKRLSMQLYYYGLYNRVYDLQDVYVDEEIENIEGIDEIFEESVDKEFDLEELKDHLLNHTLLAYIIQAIKNETDPKVKNILIKTKYNLIYLLFSLEPSFIKKPASFANPYLYKEILSARLDLDEFEDIDELYIEPIEQTILYEIDELSGLDDSYYDTFENNVIAYLKALYIKTYVSINISKKTQDIVNKIREKLALKSNKTKKYLEEATTPDKDISVLKKVDF